jgi:hypothetical protein
MPFVRGTWMRGVAVSVAAVGLMGLAGCSSVMHPFGGGNGPKATVGPDGSPTAIGVNSYLWRATLDTLSFMPLASADPYGGVVITDWYTNPGKPDERFKITVYILDARLRADGLNVAVFKQNKGPDGQWIDAPSATQTETDMENAILTRARQLRLSNIKG